MEGSEEMFYLTTHSTHFYLRLYGVRHMVKVHSDSERGNPLPPHRLLFPIRSKGSFICIIPQTGNTYHGLCYTSRGALAGTRNSSMGSSHGSIRRPERRWCCGSTPTHWAFINLFGLDTEMRPQYVRSCIH